MTATTLPTSAVPASHAPGSGSGPHRPAGRTGRPSRNGPLGLIATLGLLLVIVASAIGVTLTAPGGGDEPTSLPAGAGGTTTADASDAGADDRGNAVAPETGTAPDGTAWIRVPYADCGNVEPMAFEDAMEIVVGEDYPFDQHPPVVEIATRGDTGLGEAPWLFTTLPEGEAPDQEVIDAAVQTYATYRGCEDTALRQATAMTPEGMARDAFETPGRFAWDGEISGSYVSALWADAQGRQSNDEEHFGELTDVFLYDFRVLADDRIVAFQSFNQAWWDETVPPLYQNAGYVVFVERDGRWLIDEQFAFGPEPA